MQIFFYVFGAVTIAAAVQGAVAGSIISLIAGGILGALVLAGGYLLPTQPTTALILALVGSIGIAGKFVPTYLKKGRAIWPAGILALLSVIGIIVAIVGFVQK
ncbi:MAG: Transrane protein [Chthoniobacteraceae bacterium]|nr:Transrane protein [Chthoniobacteraceae bacterium]